MKNEDDVLKKLMSSEDVKNTQIQMILTLFVGSIILVIKNSILTNKGFVWIDCLVPSGAAFVLIFMTIYKDKTAYPIWKKRFSEPRRALFFIFLGLIGILFTLGFDYLMSYLNSKSILIDFGFTVFNISILTQYPIILLSEFFSYMFFTFFLIQIMIPPFLWCFNKIEDEIKK